MISPRYRDAQKGRTLNHPSLPQPNQNSPPSGFSPNCDYTFVVAADTQFGMTHENKDWTEEKEYSRQAVRFMNEMQNKPLFCCVCGDLVHMTSEIYCDAVNSTNSMTREECDRIQDAQIFDFQEIWKDLDPSIALVCVCGNHDVGNKPTDASIERFRTRFGDDYLGFWARRTYNIVLNTSLFNDSGGAPTYFAEQLSWLEDRLQYAVKNEAEHIFVFGHHPWFLYNQDEEPADMKGYSPLPQTGPSGLKSVDDSYFIIPKEHRLKAMALFEKYKVSAAFAGHFHQNNVSSTSFGMQMIVTSSLSLVLESTGISPDFREAKTRGLRVVNVKSGVNPSFEHTFISV